MKLKEAPQQFAHRLSAELSGEEPTNTEDRRSINKVGELDYKIYETGAVGDKNPIVLFPGSPVGTNALDMFSRDMSRFGSRKVLTPYRMNIKSFRKGNIDTKEAQLLLQLISDNGLTHTPIDSVTHSYGAIVFEAAAEMADELGWTCFKQENGASLVFIAPAGAKEDENIIKLARRNSNQLGEEAKERAVALDPKNFLGSENKYTDQRNIVRSVKEKLSVGGHKINFQRLGQLSCKPFILLYPKDSIFAHQYLAETLEKNAEHLDGIATPVDIYSDNASGFSKEEIQAAYPDKGSDEINQLYYRANHTQRHDDLVFNTKRTARAVLNYIKPKTGDLRN